MGAPESVVTPPPEPRCFKTPTTARQCRPPEHNVYKTKNKMHRAQDPLMVQASAITKSKNLVQAPRDPQELACSSGLQLSENMTSFSRSDEAAENAEKVSE